MVTYGFSLYDVKAGVFGVPFFFPADALAVRAVSDLAGDLNTVVGRHPEDFVLYRVGTFDDLRGVFEAGSPEHLGQASQFLRRQPSLPLEEFASRPVREDA